MPPFAWSPNTTDQTARDAATAAQATATAAAAKSANLADLADAGSARANIHVQALSSVRVVATTNIALTGTQTIDGVALAAGDRVLLAAQTTGSQNGPWVVAAGAWSRPTDYPSGQSAVRSRDVLVNEGSYVGRTWQTTSSAGRTIDTDATVWGPAGSDRNRAHKGRWCMPNDGYTITAAVAVDNQYRGVRVVPDHDTIVVGIGFDVTVVATANHSVDVAICDATGARLVHSGATAGKVNGTIGRQTITITPTLLRAGSVYYVALAYDGQLGGTAATVVTITPNVTGVHNFWGSGAPDLEVSAPNTGRTIPDPMAFSTASSVVWLLALLEA